MKSSRGFCLYRHAKKNKKRITQEKWLFLLTPLLLLSLSFFPSRFSVIVPVSACLYNLQSPAGSLDHCCSFSPGSLALTYAWYSISRRCTAHTCKQLICIHTRKSQNHSSSTLRSEPCTVTPELNIIL